jgi:hypothetical protein
MTIVTTNVDLHVRSFWFLILLVILAPLEVYQLLLPGGINLRLYDAFVILWSPIYLIDLMMKRVHLRKTPIILFLALYIFASLISSTIFADNHYTSIRGIATYFVIFFSFLYTISYIKGSEDLERIVSVFILIGSVVAVMALIQFFCFVLYDLKIKPPFLIYFPHMYDNPIRGAYGYMGGLMRPYSFFSSSNRVGTYLLISFFLILYRLYSSRNFNKIYLILLLISFMGIILSLSRNSLVGIILGIIIFVSFKVRKIHVIFMKIMSLIFILCAILLFQYYTPSTGYVGIDRINPFYNTTIDKNIFVNHLVAAFDANITTIGLGRGVQQFDDWAASLSYIKIWGAHSNFIIFLGESGIIGFISQVLIVFYILLLSRKLYFKKTHKHFDKHKTLLLCMVCAYCGLVFSGIVRTYYFNPYTFILIGMICSLIKIMQVNITPITRMQTFREQF